MIYRIIFLKKNLQIDLFFLNTVVVWLEFLPLYNTALLYYLNCIFYKITIENANHRQIEKFIEIYYNFNCSNIRNSIRS